MLSISSYVPALDTAAESQSLIPTGSRVSKVPDCQTPHLSNNVVVDHGSITTRIIGNSSIELADKLSPILTSVKDKTSKTGQSSGLVTVNSPKHTKNSFKCSVCTATYSYHSSLEAHMKKHNNERSHGCTLCPKAFKHRNHLNRHMRESHSSAYEFECPVCTKKFGTDTNLQNHMYIHRANKPFQCPDCSRSYASEASLNQHRKKHNSGNQITCPECPMVFYQKYALERHSYSHATEKKFKCLFCEDTYKSPYLLQRHMQAIHNFKKTKTMNNHQLSANGPGVNKPSIQKEHEETFEKTLRLLRELQDSFPAMPSRKSDAPSCDDFFPRQKMPAETLPGRQNANGDPVINQSDAMVGRLSAGGIGVNEPSIQQEHEKMFEETLRLLHELQDPFSTTPSRESDAP